jgi:radical SAM superfamily enzyme YgiQ (UPF0313 family)
VLINPPSPWLIDDRTSMPLGLLSIASYVEHVLQRPVELIDRAGGTASPIPAGHRFYGLTSATPQWPIVRELIKEIRRATPEATILVGGPHPTALPWPCLDDGADVVVLGEGETQVGQILNGASFDQIEGVVTRETRVATRAPRILDLDALPFPARERVSGYQKHTVVASRGCPFGCAFCCSETIWGRRVVTRSVPNVMAEVDELVARYGARFIVFQDETFGLKREWLARFCQEVARREVEWGIQTRAKLCTPELAIQLSAAGCREVSLGIESGSAAMLRRYRKGSPEENLSAIRNLRHAGLRCRGYFIVGLPGETETTVAETERFLGQAIAAGLTAAILGPYIPYPGCSLFVEGRPRDQRFERYYHYGSKAAGHGRAIGEDAERIRRWNDRLQTRLGELNEFVRYEHLQKRASAVPRAELNEAAHG